ncbi:hypothetical protein BASA81_005821 [Batrachochytrium salamandrivorans]|nr:hypothetical protein BASA81_005821 [Batrachochytrium salamandrivorans]
MTEEEEGWQWNEEDIDWGEPEVTSVSQTCLHCRSCCKLDQHFLTQFAVPVCFDCKRLPEYRLISKTRAAQEYLLNDVELGKLGSMEVRNPKLDRRNMMRLFLLQQVKLASSNKWNGELGLEEEKSRRLRQQEKRAQKRPKFSLVAPSSVQVGSKTAPAAESIRKLAMTSTPLTTRAVELPSKQHRHEFGEATPTGEEDEYEHTCLGCGLTAKFESF